MSGPSLWAPPPAGNTPGGGDTLEGSEREDRAVVTLPVGVVTRSSNSGEAGGGGGGVKAGVARLMSSSPAGAVS